MLLSWLVKSLDVIQAVEISRTTELSPLSILANLYKRDEMLGEEPYLDEGESVVGPPPNSASTVLFTSASEGESGMEDEMGDY